LNKSVLDNSPDTVQHHIIVPRSDLKLFGRLADTRTHIRCEADLLPRTFVRVPLVNITVNVSRPFPPVRGWIQQQVVKLAAIAASEDDVVLVVDSDVEFFRAYFAQGRPAFHGMSVHGFTPGRSSAREAGRSRLSLSDVCGSSPDGTRPNGAHWDF
jgi:hypothetical protein